MTRLVESAAVRGEIARGTGKTSSSSNGSCGGRRSVVTPETEIETRSEAEPEPEAGTEPDRPPARPAERWAATWAGVERAQLETVLTSTTPAERLAWLEEAMRLAHASGALPLARRGPVPGRRGQR